MKKVLICIFFFVTLFLPTTLVLADTTYGSVIAEIGINVRSGPGTTFDKIGTGISTDQIVTILEELPTSDESSSCDIWYKIKYLQVEEGYGYACSNWIKKLESDVNSEFEAMLLTFPESYQEKLRELHVIYPNAVFRPYYIELDFNDVVNNEKTIGKNLLWDNNNSRNGLKNINTYNILTNTFRNDFAGGGVNWYAASDDTIAYYLDPRNFLNEVRIFMFESLSYNSLFHNVEGVENALKNSFMYNTTVDKSDKNFSTVIYEAGIKYGISPYYIASRILQETGKSRSSLVKGTYPSYPEYNGYYNFYNYGASGNNVVLNGLKYAKNKGWNSEEKAIIGGAGLIGTNYISAGQDTNYFQKWDVICKSKYDSSWSGCNYYVHQYMQNIEAPYSEASITYNAYKSYLNEDLYNMSYVFTIPIYQNMPDVTVLPNSDSPINYLNSLVVNDSVLNNFESLNYDYFINIPSYMNTINISATAIDPNAKIIGLGDIEVVDKQVLTITVEAKNGNKLDYHITVNIKENTNMDMEETLKNMKNGIISNNYIYGFTNVDAIKSAFYDSNYDAVVNVKNKAGEIVTENVGTGYKIEIEVLGETKELEVIMIGDTNGDCEITILDLLRVQKYLLNSVNMTEAEIKSCDINKDDVIDILDLLLVRKHLLGSSLISQ